MASRLLIEILHGLSIEGLLPNAVLGTSYSAQLTARNAVLPLLWQKVGGTWPPTGSWTINASTGEVTGAADDAGLYDVTIQCTDGAGSFGIKNFRFRVAAAPLVFAGDLPDATVGDSAVYSYTISGGVGVKTVSLVSGALPAGASIDSAGNVTGTYTTGDSYAWVLKVVDGDLTEAFLSDAAVIAWPTLAKTGALTDSPAGGPVLGSLTLSGGDGTYTLDASPVSGTRPAGNGLALVGAVYSDSSGVLTTAATYTWTDRFRSGDGQTLDVANSIVVSKVVELYIAGGFTTLGGSTRNRVGRFLSAGTLDSWNPNVNNQVNAVLKQADGKIVVTGYFTTIGGVSRNRIARLNSDGTLDTGFSPSFDGAPFALGQQSDGKLIVGGGFTSISGTPNAFVCRLTTSGALDTPFAIAAYTVYCIQVASDDTVTISGGFTNVNSVSRQYLAKLNSDGSVNTGFANPSLNSDAYAHAVQSDGKVVVGGQFTVAGGSARKYLARINANGTVDSGFPDPNCNGTVSAVAIQSDGKILVGGGFTSIASTSRNRIARLNTDGTIDTGFNPNAGATVRSISILQDGKILVGGDFTTMGGTARNRVALLNADGTLAALDPNAGGQVFFVGEL